MGELEGLGGRLAREGEQEDENDYEKPAGPQN